MAIIWRKVWRDLWSNKLRTILVILATAVGVFALGLVFGMSNVMRARMTESHRESNAPHITVYTSRFGEDVVEAMLRERGVATAEGEVRDSFRWKLEGDEEWEDGTLIARDNYGRMNIHAQYMYPIELMEGEWPIERTLAIERMSAQHYGLPIGTSILVEVGRRIYRLPIVGVVRHPYTPPPQMGIGNATFCTTLETIAWLTEQEEGFNTLNARLETYTEEGANEAAERITDRLERIGVGVGFYEVIDPDTHWAQEQMDAIFLILTVLGAISLGVSGFLIVNTMNAIIAQQVWQIGLMKVCGATSGMVMRIYLMMALIYGLLALLLAVPLGAIAAFLMASWMLDFFNIFAGGFRLMPEALGIQAGIGLAVPLVAALAPVISGARITPYKAISTYGLGSGFGLNWLDRLVGSIRHLPRTLAMSLRNTFRRKGRLALTLVTLVLGGMMFIVVMSVGSSLNNTLEVLLDDFGFDALVIFDRLHRVTQLIEIAESVPEVTKAEVWDQRPVQLALPSGEDHETYLWGVPPDSAMFDPRIIEGRDLLPSDDQAMLLNSKIAADEGFEVGDELELTINGRESTWTVVGLVVNINNQQNDNFAPFDALARATGDINRGAVVMVKFDPQSTKAHKTLMRDLRNTYSGQHVKVAYTQSSEEIREQSRSSFKIIVYLMLAMAILAALVGSIGLMSTMATNVVERGREIGIMRATGAISRTIAGIFVAEGILVGVMSWLIAAPLSYPGALIFSNVIGMTLMDLPLNFSFSVGGVLIWFIIVVTLSALASLWPAVRATRISVHETLAYE